MYHQNTLKILSLQYVVMFAVYEVDVLTGGDDIR